jgi:hypothetical protein
MAVVDVDAVRGTGSMRRRLLCIGVRLALTAGFAVAGWLLCGLAASAASASELPQTPSSATSATTPTDNGGGLLGGLLGNTVGSLGNTVNGTVNTLLGTVNTTVNTTLSTVNTTLGTVGTTVTSIVDSVGTTVVDPTVTGVSNTVAPVVAPLVPANQQPVTDEHATGPASTTTATVTNPQQATPSPAAAAVPVVKPVHHAAVKAVPAKAMQPVLERRPDSGSLPLPKAPQPAPQQPLAPAPTISTGHGPNGGNRYAVFAVVSNAGGSALAQLTTVASHPIIIPGDMPGLPSVSPD